MNEFLAVTVQGCEIKKTNMIIEAHDFANMMYSTVI
jgi:hypothetical protein